MLHRFILHNDSIREASEQVLSAGQVGLLSGWGVFTTIQVTEGIPFAFERHWARLTRDAAALHVPIPSDAEAVRRRLLELIEANQAYQSTLRLVFVRNGGGIWASAAPDRPNHWIRCRLSDCSSHLASSISRGSPVRRAFE